MSASPQMDATPKQSWVMRKLRQFWPVIPLAAILFALMLSDLDVMGYTPMGSSPCSFDEVNQSGVSAKLYGPLTQRAVTATPPASTSVVIVTIDANTEPPGLLNNTCASRDFLARLVGDLNTLGARVIMIDKYYSADSCADADKTAHFVSSLESSHARVVVGQATHSLGTSGGCLALTPRLEFDPVSVTPGVPASPCKVCFGLNRLDSDTLKIPLRWPLFERAPGLDPSVIQPAMSLPSAPAPAPTPVADVTKGNGLALMAAAAYNPDIMNAPKLQKVLNELHPYTTFIPLPTVNAMTALCNAEPGHTYGVNGDPTVQATGADLCTPWLKTPDEVAALKHAFDGKVVVVGDLSEQDLHPFPGGDQPGVYLQANYVQSILDLRFLQQIPLPLTLFFLILYVIGVYCLYWAHDVHGQPRFNAEQAGLRSVFVLLALVVVSLAALFKFQYYTPLWALWGAGVFMVFRYLEASGHHRSQHLLHQLSGAAHHPDPASKKETE